MPLTQGLQLGTGLQPTNPVPTDSWAGPYVDVSQANASVPMGVRFEGREVVIWDGVKAKIYGWYVGIGDGDLEEFSSGGGALTDGSGTTANGTSVDLGGTLANNTTIDLGEHDFYILGEYVESNPVSPSGESLGVGNASTVTAYTGSLEYGNIIPFTININDTGFNVFISDDGSGNLTGDATGTIDYVTGAYSFVTSNAVPGTETIEASYQANTSTTKAVQFDIRANSSNNRLERIITNDDGATTSSGRWIVGDTYVDLSGYYLSSYVSPTEYVREVGGVEASGSGTRLGRTRLTVDGGVTQANQDIVISPAAMTVRDQINLTGLVYDADYSANYTNRSLVDKEYVDSVAGGGGWAVTGTTTLTGNVLIDGDSNYQLVFDNQTGIYFNDTNGNGVYFNDDGAGGVYFNDNAGGGVWFEGIGGGGVYFQDQDGGGTYFNDFGGGGIYLGSASHNDGDGIYLTARNTAIALYTLDNTGATLTGLDFTQTNVTFTDSRATTTGIEYAADYSANFTARSLVDKAYVDTVAGGGSWGDMGEDKFLYDSTSGVASYAIVFGADDLASYDADDFDDAIKRFYVQADEVIGLKTLQYNSGEGLYNETESYATISQYRITAARLGEFNYENEIFDQGDRTAIDILDSGLQITKSRWDGSGIDGRVSFFGNQGFTYAADYSANYTNRSLVDKEYVDDAISSGSSYTFNTGLNESGGTVKWGGTVAEDVNITAAANSMILISGTPSAGSGGSNLSIYTTSIALGFYPDGANSSIVAQDGQIIMQYIDYTNSTSANISATNAGVYLQYTDPTGAARGSQISCTSSTLEIEFYNTSLSQSRSKLTFGEDDITVLGQSSFTGLMYAADYSANFGNRSLVDKEYVDNAVGGGSYTFSNGIAESGGDVKLGGQLIESATIIDLNSNVFAIANATVTFGLIFTPAANQLSLRGPSSSEINMNSSAINIDGNTLGVNISGSENSYSSTNGTIQQLLSGTFIAANNISIATTTSLIIDINGDAGDAGDVLSSDGTGGVVWLPGGSSYTFANGLAESGGDVTLGGLLTVDTEIYGFTRTLDFGQDGGQPLGLLRANAQLIEFTANDAGGIKFRQSGDNQINITNANIDLYTNTDVGINIDFLVVELDAINTVLVTGIGGGFTGVTYAADYSANYVDRSLVDKEYVDDAITAGAFTLTDGNGTTANGTAVDLGGILTANAVIDLDTYTLSLGTINIIDNKIMAVEGGVPFQITDYTDQHGLYLGLDADSDPNGHSLVGYGGGLSISSNTISTTIFYGAAYIKVADDGLVIEAGPSVVLNTTGDIDITTTGSNININSADLIALDAAGTIVSISDSAGITLAHSSGNEASVTGSSIDLHTNTDVGISIDFADVTINAVDSVIIGGLDGGFEGAVYAANYAANYTDRSLVDREYVLSIVNPTPITQNISGAVSIDLSTGSTFYLTLTADVTSFTFTNEVVGRQYTFYFLQDTSYKTLTFTAAKFRFSQGTAPTLTDPTTNGTAGPARSVDIMSAHCQVSGRLDAVLTQDMIEN